MCVKRENLSFSTNHKHLMATLLSFKFIVLILYISIYYYLNLYNFELYFRIIIGYDPFVCMCVCVFFVTVVDSVFQNFECAAS